MAKGNLFLGTAARSVGDVVMYRREGSQVSRVRVRKIANPKTDAQCEQRAFMAAVVKFYQPLANVLDRSWQGLSRAKSYAKFLKTNVAFVRDSGYYLDKNTGFFPLPLQLSNGTLAPLPQTYDADSMRLEFTLQHVATTATSVGDLSQDLIAAGYKNGDVFTAVLIGFDNVADVYFPVSIQFEIDSTSTASLGSLDTHGFSVSYDAEDGWYFGQELDKMKGGAIIISRPVDGQWIRTKTSLGADMNLVATIHTPEAKAAAIASYKGAAASDNPLVYLDGDELV